MTENHTGRIPVRVRVGVTGHRADLNEAAVRKQVEAALTWIEQQTADEPGGKVRLTAVSSLARGSDRIVARAVLERRGDLEAPLPLQPADYRTDFHERSDRAEFDDLLVWGTATVVSSSERSRAYRDASRYVVDNSDVLVAIWDGSRGGEGGTGRTVRYARRHRRPLIRITPDGADIHYPRHARCEASRYNRRSAHVGSGDRAAAEFAHLPADKLERLGLTNLAAWSSGMYARADAAARSYHFWYHVAGAAVFVSAALSVTIAGGQAAFRWPASRMWLEVGSVLFGAAIVLLSRMLRLHERFLACRSLAERFRSSFYLSLVRSRPAPTPRGHATPAADRGERWSLDADRDAWATCPHPVPHLPYSEHLRDIVHSWVDHQRAYHHGAAHRNAAWERTTRRIVEVAITIVVLIGAAHALELGGEESTARWLSFLAVAVPVNAAALSGYAVHREFRRHASRSERAVIALDGISEDLDGAEEIVALENCVQRAATVMNDEGREWFGVMVVRVIEAEA